MAHKSATPEAERLGGDRDLTHTGDGDKGGRG